MTGDLVVAGGTLVTGAACARGDVLVRDGRIVALGEVGHPRGATAVDAGDCLVMPGGVDVHAHVFGRIAEDTLSALHGGTTTVLSFIPERPGLTPAAIAREMIAEEVPRAHVDIGIHGVVWEPDRLARGDVAELATIGVTSLKLWLAYRELGIMIDDAGAYRAMREAAAAGILVQAHCENGGLVDALREEHVDEGRVSLRHHGEARPAALEAEAVARFLAIARLAGARAHVVHVTCRPALDEIRRARRRGTHVSAEACPHHLAFDESRYRGPEPERFLMTPPLRSPADREALWDALGDGTLGVLASDHSHLPLAERRLGGDDFTRVEPGVPGIETRLALGFTLGVEEGRITPETLVRLACEEPARAFSLAGRKGVLAPGADADIVVWDRARRWTLASAALHDGLDYTPYEGMEMIGAPRTVIVGGEIAMHDGVPAERRRPPAYLARGAGARAASGAAGRP